MEVKFVIEMVLKEERVGEIERVLKRHFDKYGWPRAYRAYTTPRVEEESSRQTDILRRAGYKV